MNETVSDALRRSYTLLVRRLTFQPSTTPCAGGGEGAHRLLPVRAGGGHAGVLLLRAVPQAHRATRAVLRVVVGFPVYSVHDLTLALAAQS